MTRASSKLPVLVLGSGLNALGVVRSLAGVSHVHLAATTTPSCEFRTRFATKHRIASLGGDESATDKLVDELRSFALAHGRPLVIPTQERTVASLVSRHEQLVDHVELCHDDPAVTEALLDKGRFHDLARDGAFPVPETRFIKNEKDLNNMPMPCVLKPTTRNALYEASNAKAYRLDTDAQLRAVYSQASRSASQFALQQWIEGADDTLYFCILHRAREGGSPVAFTGRKLLQWPPGVGGTARCTGAPEHHNTLLDMTDRFFNHVGYTGLGAIEFKRDAVSNLFYMIEPTVGRPDLQHEVSTLNGVNVLRAMVQRYRGEPVHAGSYRTPTVIWNDALSVANVERTLVGTVPTPDNNLYDALWRPNDPLPWLCSIVRRAQRKLLTSLRAGNNDT